jgi:hypothetical protein
MSFSLKLNFAYQICPLLEHLDFFFLLVYENIYITGPYGIWFSSIVCVSHSCVDKHRSLVGLLLHCSEYKSHYHQMKPAAIATVVKDLGSNDKGLCVFGI